MALVVSVSNVIDSKWGRLIPIRVGRVPANLRTPELYVAVEEDDVLLLRVDVYAFEPDIFAFQEALIWRDNLVIGFGSRVHAISFDDHSVVTVELGSYYGHMYPTPEYLLIASAERLFRIEPTRKILWSRAPLALDGVVVSEPGPPVIRGDAEMDPPGAWQPFAILARDGSRLT